ncbi:MAG TPA: hypothetical protein VEU30_17465 [Thermoanaerobaculia bacterium]|nr:hypothetical protein [Thermoanaerobaculia bacterium]
MSKLRTILAVLLALFGILTLLERFVLIELLVRRAAVPLLLALAEGTAILAAGALLRRSKQIDVPRDFLIGYPAFGTICFLVALVKVSVWTMVPLLVLFGLAGITLLLMRYADDRSAGVPPATGGASRAAVIPIVTILACAFVVAQHPPSHPDELTHHLAIPQTWVLETKAVDLPLLSHASLPLGIESADLPLLTLLGPTDGGVASHMLHLLSALAVSLVIAWRTNSWLAAAAIVTTPALAVTAGASLIIWPLTGLFVLLWASLEDDDRRTASAATAAGLLTSYLFLPFAIVAWAVKRRIPSWVALAGIVFFIRNAAALFSGDVPLLAGYRASGLPELLYNGKAIAESFGASLLILAPFASGLLPMITLAAGVVLVFLAPASRMLVPLFAVPAMSAAPSLQRKLVATLVAIAVVVQTLIAVWVTGRAEPTEPPSEVTWLNETLPPRSRTLVVGMSETYWFARPVRGAGPFDAARLASYLDVPVPEALRDRFRRDGITHVAIITIGDTPQTTLPPAAQKMLAQTLDRFAGTVTTRGGTALFTLR